VAAPSGSAFGTALPPPQRTAPAVSRVIRVVALADTPRPFRWLIFVLLTLSLGLLGIAAIPDRALPAGPAAVALAQRRAQLAIAGISLLPLIAIVIALT
jgi:hypothetical protein